MQKEVNFNAGLVVLCRTADITLNTYKDDKCRRDNTALAVCPVLVTGGKLWKGATPREANTTPKQNKYRRRKKGTLCYLAAAMLLVIPEARRLTSAEEDHSQEQQDGGWQQGLHTTHGHIPKATYLDVVLVVITTFLHLWSFLLCATVVGRPGQIHACELRLRNAMHASAHGHGRVGLQALSADNQPYLPAGLAGSFTLRFTVLETGTSVKQNITLA